MLKLLFIVMLFFQCAHAGSATSCNTNSTLKALPITTDSEAKHSCESINGNDEKVLKSRVFEIGISSLWRQPAEIIDLRNQEAIIQTLRICPSGCSESKLFEMHHKMRPENPEVPSRCSSSEIITGQSPEYTASDCTESTSNAQDWLTDIFRRTSLLGLKIKALQPGNCSVYWDYSIKTSESASGICKSQSFLTAKFGAKRTDSNFRIDAVVDRHWTCTNK